MPATKKVDVVELAGGIKMRISSVAVDGDYDAEVSITFDADLVPVHTELLLFGPLRPNTLPHDDLTHDPNVLMLVSLPAMRPDFLTERDIVHRAADPNAPFDLR